MHSPVVSLPRRRRTRAFAILLLPVLLFGSGPTARGEAMLQLFNVNWEEMAQKMPEIAEAGYTSLWLPPPAKGGSVFSVGYDLFDPFDLGDKNQRGTVRTRYGTRAELLRVVELAHRFGLRVYFDNIMNHRGFDTPGYNANTPTNLYPGLTAGDFHLQRLPNGDHRNWNSISDYNNLFQVLNRPLFGLVDLANEPGSLNLNYGPTEGSTATKPVFIRQPANPGYYMDTNLPAIAGPWRPFNGNLGDPVPEDVNAYLIRAALWMVHETRCDGFRFDAVKHVPSGFFGATTANHEGYTGAIQTMFDYVHGYGNNVLGNGYIEGDSNRNSCFDTEAPRNDAMLFGEHLGQPPGFQEYIDRGMRLLGAPLHFHLNNVFGNPSASLAGLEQRDPPVAPFSPINSVLFAQSHDDGFANRRELHNAYNFFREGLPAIYSDGYNQSGPPDFFPRVANAPYLGQFGDNKMPELAWIHHQLARGGTRPRWGDADIVAFERYDYREPGSAADQTVVVFAMNDNYGFPGDVAFVDGEGEAFPSGVNAPPGAGAQGNQGLAVSFPPGSVLSQLAVSTPGYDRTYKRVTVRPATNSRSVAQGSGGGTVFVGSQVIPAGGGAIEILIPSGGYVSYGYHWPEPSRANRRDVITLRQGGQDAPRITVHRRDGVNGDSGFNPIHPFRNRGSVNEHGVVVGGVNVSNRTYAIDVPIVTNAPLDLVFRVDGSANNVLAKLDGGMDLNSHLGFGPLTGDRRDNRPGSATDVFLGYEQAQFVSRTGPEKFAAMATNRNNTVSEGAETYHYFVGNSASNRVVLGNGNDWTVTNATAAWAIHSPSNATTIVGGGPATQRVPLHPAAGQDVDIHVRAGFKFHMDRCVLYYTTDGSNPEGAFGVGRGTTRVVSGGWVNEDSINNQVDWWKATIPAADNTPGAQIRYKIALYQNFVLPISDALKDRQFGLTTFALTNFNPATAAVWLHNNRNPAHTATGLAEGFHIVRARTFLPREGKSSVFNTFAQTFYYDAAPPAAAMAFPASGATIAVVNYEVIIRTDASATSVEVNISDSSAANDDAATGLLQGNGLTNGTPAFAPANPVAPAPTLDALHPGLPREWRFTYAGVPSSGTATLTVRVSEATTAVLPGRMTILTNTINTLAPARVLFFSTPASSGPIALAATNSTILLRACNSTAGGETADPNNYTLRINGVPVPQTNWVFGTSPACGAGFNSLAHRWGNIPAGTNVLEVTFTGSVFLSDTRIVVISYPPPPNLDTDGDGMSDLHESIAGTNPNDPDDVLRIIELADGNRAVVWASVAGRVYRVLATTDLTQPLQPVSGLIQASSELTFFYDNAAPVDQKFYRIEVVP